MRALSTWRTVEEEDPVAAQNVLVNSLLCHVETHVGETKELLLDVFLEHQRLPQSLSKKKTYGGPYPRVQHSSVSTH